jgi:hypothetical protein
MLSQGGWNVVSKKGQVLSRRNRARCGRQWSACWQFRWRDRCRVAPIGRDWRRRHKIVAGWTGANEKTVKNWFSGRHGPSGEHLAVLVRQSDEVLSTFLIMAGRQDLMAVVKLAAAEKAIMDLLEAVRSLTQIDEGDC